MRSVAWALAASLAAAAGITFLIALGVYTSVSEETLPPWAAVALVAGSVVGVMVAGASLIIGWWFHREGMGAQMEALEQEQRLRTLEYLQAQLATPAVHEARTWLKAAKDRLHEGQSLGDIPPAVIDLCDLCNHVAGGLRTRALSASVVQAIIPFQDPNSWFVNNWDALASYIEGLRQRLGASPTLTGRRLCKPRGRARTSGARPEGRSDADALRFPGDSTDGRWRRGAPMITTQGAAGSSSASARAPRNRPPSPRRHRCPSAPRHRGRCPIRR